MTGEIGQEWIEQDFDAQTRELAGERYCLLIVDGHSSHFSWELLEFAKANKIVVLCLPANTTHALQSMFHSELTVMVSNKLSSLGCHWICSVQAKI